ncbi:MAG: hypothetical protein ABSH25_06465 [Syntrophorhabdales bacterium]|jgi:hypothetical protein
MKKLIVLAIIMAVMVLVAALAHAQAPPNDLKPTFISPTPGLYVNGWPAFTLSYPKEWVETPVAAQISEGLMAGAVRPGSEELSPLLSIAVFVNGLPLEDWAKIHLPFFMAVSTDVKVLSDKPLQLKDGTRAREAEFEFVPKVDLSGRSVKNPAKHNVLYLATKRDLTWVTIFLVDDRGRIGEDLKEIAYSLTFQSDREKPVNVPLDVKAFLDMYCADVVGHDVKTIMAHYSDRFLQFGASKAFTERGFRNDPLYLGQAGPSLEATVTVFEPHGDKAYIDGFFLRSFKPILSLKAAMGVQQIVNEHGQWKWFGNQK